MQKKTPNHEKKESQKNEARKKFKSFLNEKEKAISKCHVMKFSNKSNHANSLFLYKYEC